MSRSPRSSEVTAGLAAVLLAGVMGSATPREDLRTAIRAGDVAAMAELLAADAALANAGDERQMTPVVSVLLESPSEKRLALLDALVAHGAKLQTPFQGFTPALLCLGNRETIAWLVAHGVELSEREKLLAAAAGGDLEELRRQADAGVDLDADGPPLQTPLGWAVAGGQLAAVNLLLARGVNPNVTPALPVSNLLPDDPLLLALLAHGLELTPDAQLKQALQTADEVRVRALLTATPELLQTPTGPLLNQVVCSAPKLIAAVIACGADVNGVAPRTGRTPLQAAAECGNTASVSPLVSAQALVDAQTDLGETALLLAVRAGHQELAASLRAAGADPCVATVFGETPMPCPEMPATTVAFRLVEPVADTAAIEQAIAARLRSFGFERWRIAFADQTVQVTVPTRHTDVIDALVTTVLKPGQLSFATVHDDHGQTAPTGYVEATLPRSGASGGERLYIAETRTQLGQQITARCSRNEFGGWRINIAFDATGREQFAELTKRLQGQRLAITINDRTLSAPMIREPISGGKAEISGRLGAIEAHALAAAIDGPSLPTALVQTSRTATTWPDNPH